MIGDRWELVKGLSSVKMQELGWDNVRIRKSIFVCIWHIVAISA